MLASSASIHDLPVVNPEQRLSIREAVELIAQHGEKPISESALRSRAKTKRLGVSRVNGRIYTNPLNLASAGLIPIGVVTATVVPTAIDDNELHAWLGSSASEKPVHEAGPLERLLDDEVPDSCQDGVADDPRGAGVADEATPSPADVAAFDDTLDDFLGAGETDAGAAPASLRDTPGLTRTASAYQPADGPDIAETALTTAHQAPGLTRPKRGWAGYRRPRLIAAAVFGIAAVLVAIAVLGGGAEPPRREQVVNRAAVAADAEERRQAVEIADAEQRGDFDRVMRLASFAGNQSAYNGARSDATEALLDRARAALRDDRIETARRYVRRVERGYGDPDPSGRRSVEHRIQRAERAAERDRARAAEARRAKRARAAARRAAPAPAPATQQAASPTPRTTTPAPSTANSGGSSAAGTTTAKPKSQTPAPSSSGSKSDARDPEFF